MAIASEVAVKHRLFGHTSAAALAFEFLEHKGNVKIRVIDMIHSVAMQVFRESFRDEFPDEDVRIDYLYRCRNKKAHRGSTRFHDNPGGEIKLAGIMRREWWDAQTTLFK